MGQVFFVLAKNAYVYYVDGVTTKAVIVQVTEGRKYDTDLHKTVSWLDAEAEYEHGTINCRVKLDRIPTSQSGYDTYRKGRHVSVYYLPQMPCSGKSEPFRNISFVIMMGGFCILLGSFLIYYIGRKVRS